MAYRKELVQLSIRYKDGRLVENTEIQKALMDTRSVICDKMNGGLIEQYNALEDQLCIDDKEERLICDERAYLGLFFAGWTCEMMRRGYHIRIIDEYILPPESRDTWLIKLLHKKVDMGLIVITIEDI